MFFCGWGAQKKEGGKKRNGKNKKKKKTDLDKRLGGDKPDLGAALERGADDVIQDRVKQMHERGRPILGEVSRREQRQHEIPEFQRLANDGQVAAAEEGAHESNVAAADIAPVLGILARPVLRQRLEREVELLQRLLCQHRRHAHHRRHQPEGCADRVMLPRREPAVHRLEAAAQDSPRNGTRVAGLWCDRQPGQCAGAQRWDEVAGRKIGSINKNK